MCMVYRGSKILVQDKVDEDYNGITFPGGHVEKGESFTDAVIREVYEETGLKIFYPKLCGIKDWTENSVRYMVLLYKTDKFEGNLKPSDEGEVFWTEKDALHNMRIAAGMNDVLKVFLDETLSEFYYYMENGKWTHALK